MSDKPEPDKDKLMDRTLTAKQLRQRDDQVERATAKAYATELRQMGAQVPSGTAYDRGVRAGLFAAADHARDLAPERVRAEMLSEYTNKQTVDVLWSLVDRLGNLTLADSDTCPDRKTYVKALRHARALLGMLLTEDRELRD